MFTTMLLMEYAKGAFIVERRAGQARFYPFFSKQSVSNVVSNSYFSFCSPDCERSRLTFLLALIAPGSLPVVR